MKKFSKNILTILICFMLIFSLHIVKPHQKAKADFGITLVTVGGIALASLAIGGLAHISINEDARNAIAISAQNVFKNATESVKDDFINAIERYKLHGENGLKLASATWDWLQNALESVASDLIKWIPTLAPTIDYNPVTLVNTISPSYTYGIFELDQYINIDGDIYKGILAEIKSDGSISRRSLSRHILIQDLTITTVPSTGYRTLTIKSAYHLDDNDFLIGLKSYLNSTIDMDTYHQVDHWANQVGNSLDKVFQSSRQHGKLYVPIDGLMGVGDGSVGLNYDLSADRWVVSQTGEHWLGDVSLDLDQIGVITDATTGAIAYNPDLDIPRVGIRDVTGTITDTFTGENVGTIETDIPIDGSWAIPNVAVPPPSVPGQINWDKLKYSGEIFTTAFPFSLPFDIYNALNASFVDVSQADFTGWDLPINFNNKTYKFKVKIPDAILFYLPFWNSFVLIMFDVSLIYAIRKWFGGAS